MINVKQRDKIVASLSLINEYIINGTSLHSDEKRIDITFQLAGFLLKYAKVFVNQLYIS